MSYFTERAKQLGINLPEAGQAQPGESYFQQRARELGASLTPQQSQPEQSDFFTQRQMELGIIPDTRKPQFDVHSGMNVIGIQDIPNLQNSPVLQQSQQYAQTHPAPVEETKIGRDIPVIGSVLRGLDVVATNPVTEAVANIGRSLYTPGGTVANVAGFAGSVGSTIGRLAPRLGSTLGGRVAQEAIKEGVTGIPLGAGQALATGHDDLGDVAQQGLFGGALGAAGGAAAPLIGRGIGKAGEAFNSSRLGQTFSEFLNRNKPAQPELLGLPDPVLYLPEPKILPPTAARMESQANPFKDKLESLFAEGKRLQENGQLRPGLERETLDDLWSRMAGPQDPSLDELISLAYPTRLNRLTPDLVQQAKGYQQSRQVAGAPMPVRTSMDRYESGVISPAAAPKMRFERVTPPQVIDIEPMQAMKGNWFTNLFGNQGIGISAFNSAKRIRKDPLTTSDQIVGSPLKRDIQGLKANVQATGRAVLQNHVDMLKPLQKISPQTYAKSIDAARANNIANTIVRDKFVSPEGVVVGEGLTGTFKKVARGQTKNFLDYIVLRHAATRVSRGERVYHESLKMTPERIQQRMAQYEKQFPEFKNIATEWDKYNGNMLKTYGVDEGLISEDMFKMLREKNPNYAPMRRQFSTSEKFASPLSLGAKPTFSGQKAPIKEVSPTGSVRNIVDPRRSAIEATGAWVNAAMRNRVMQSIVDKIKVNPEAMKGIAEIVQKPKGQKNLREVLELDGQEGLLESLDHDFNKLFKRTRLDEDNIVRAMIKGEPVYIKVNDPEAVKALVGMGAEQSNLVMDMFGTLSTATKFGATGALAPMFAVKGLTTDIAQSLIQSKNPAVHLWDLGHAIVSSLADTLPRNTVGVDAIRALAQEFRRTGGEYSAALRGDRPLRKSVRGMNRNPILSPQGIAQGAGKLVAAPFKALHKVSDISENVNRMAAYKGELRRLGGERTPDNVMQAMNQAREITTNFSRKGTQSQTIEKFVPYSNAAIQGMQRFIQQWRQNPIKTTALVGGTVMAPKAIEYFRFHDDPDYQQLPAREKYRNLIVNKNADGTFSKVPMPPEYNALGAFMVDALEYFRDDNPIAFKGAKDAIANAYTPPQVSGLAQPFTQGGGAETALTGGLGSTVLAPAVSVVSNRDFAGRPIESMALSDRSPQNRYDERTSSIAKTLGEGLKMSPKKVDYLIRSYGGDPARMLMPLTSEAGAGDVRNTLLKNFIVDPAFTSNLTNDFYAAKEVLNQAYRDNKEVGTSLPEWYDDGLRKLISSTGKGSLSSKLSNLSDEKKTLNVDKSLTNQQRTQKLRDIQRQMNEIYLEANTTVADKQVPIPRR